MALDGWIVRGLVVLATASAPATAAADSGPYIGVATVAALYSVDYQKGVDSRDPANISANAGQILFSSDSANRVTWDAAALIGYRFAFAVANLDIEVSAVSHRGTASGRLDGEGSSPGRNQLGEVWPEDWTLAKDRSYGLTARLGAPVPAFGSIYALAGIQRLDAVFRTAYTGCLLASGCTASEYTSGRERHDEHYYALTLGFGLEKRLGPLSLRGELVYTDHGASERTVPFTDVAVVVPVELATRELGVGAGLVWRL